MARFGFLRNALISPSVGLPFSCSPTTSGCWAIQVYMLVVPPLRVPGTKKCNPHWLLGTSFLTWRPSCTGNVISGPLAPSASAPASPVWLTCLAPSRVSTGGGWVLGGWQGGRDARAAVPAAHAMGGRHGGAPSSPKRCKNLAFVKQCHACSFVVNAATFSGCDEATLFAS